MPEHEEQNDNKVDFRRVPLSDLLNFVRYQRKTADVSVEEVRAAYPPCNCTEASSDHPVTVNEGAQYTMGLCQRCNGLGCLIEYGRVLSGIVVECFDCGGTGLRKKLTK